VQTLCYFSLPGDWHGACLFLQPVKRQAGTLSTKVGGEAAGRLALVYTPVILFSLESKAKKEKQ